MTKPDPAWNLLKAAEHAERVLKDAGIVLNHVWRLNVWNVEDAIIEECESATDYLREAITAYKEARNAEAS